MQVNDWKSWTPKLDQNGQSIINWSCLKTVYKFKPWDDIKRIDEDFK